MASPETIKALNTAAEMTQSAASKAKEGGEVDPAAIGKIIEVLNGVKGQYPSPKSKTLTPTEFVAYAKDEIAKASAEADPTTRVARLARLQQIFTEAEKQFGSGAPAVTVHVQEGQPEGVTVPAPTTQVVSPLAAQPGAMATQFSQNVVKEIADAVADALDKAKKPKPEEEEEDEAMKALEDALVKAKKKEPPDEETCKALEAMIEKAKKAKKPKPEEEGGDGLELSKAWECPKCGYKGVPGKGGKCPKCEAQMEQKSVKKSDFDGWERDLAPSPHGSEDPALRWGHNKPTANRDFGRDPQ